MNTQSLATDLFTNIRPLDRAPHTVYMKSLYRIDSQDYCRHHIVRAAVTTGVIAEVKPGTSQVVAVPQGVPSEEYFRSCQG